MQDYFTYSVVAFHTHQNNQTILLWFDDFNSIIIVASRIDWKHTYQQLRRLFHFLPLHVMIQRMPTMTHQPRKDVNEFSVIPTLVL